MRWTASSEHRDFFESHSFISFENFFNKEQMESLTEELKDFLCKKLKTSKKLILSLDPEEIFMSGRDLSREIPSLRRIVCNKQLGKIAGELMLKKSLRLAYDQILSSSFADPTPKSTAFFQLLKSTHRLSEISAIQGILGGALILLSEETTDLKENSERQDKEEEVTFSSHSIFPKKPGDVVFFNHYFPLSFELFYKRPKALFLLITFAETNAVYIHNEKDPHTHSLKSIDYVFGDRLKEKYHPTLYREGSM